MSLLKAPILLLGDVRMNLRQAPYSTVWAPISRLTSVVQGAANTVHSRELLAAALAALLGGRDPKP